MLEVMFGVIFGSVVIALIFAIGAIWGGIVIFRFIVVRVIRAVRTFIADTKPVPKAKATEDSE